MPGDVIAKLAVDLGLSTAAFEKGTGKAKREVSSLQSHISKAGRAIQGAVVGMFGAFAVGQIADMAKEALDYASSLGEVAAQLGLTTKELQEYRFAATQTGIEQDDMDKGLAKLSRTIGAAAGGNEKAAKIFDRLGISIRDSNGNVRAAGDILPEIADQYTKLGSAAEQSALSAEVFGSKLGQKLNPLLAEGAKGIQAYREEAQRMGLVLSDDVIANADNAADTLGKLEQFIKMKFTATVADNAEEIGNLANELIDLIGAIGSVREEWRKLELMMKQIDIWTEPLGTSSWASRMQRSSEIGRERDLYRREESDAYKRGLDAANRSAELQRSAPAFFGASGGNLLKIPKRAPARPANTPWGPTVQPGLSRAIGGSAFGGGFGQFLPGQGEGFIRMAQAAKEMVTPTTAVADAFMRMSGTDAPRLLETMRKMTPEMDRLRDATQNILDRLFPDEAEARRYAEELAILNTALEKGQISLTTHGQAVLALRREYQGFNEAVEEAAQILSTQVGPSLDEISDAISERLPTELGKMADGTQAATVRVAQSFADMAESIGSSLGSLIGGKVGGILSGILNIGLQFGRAGAFGSGVTNWLNKIPAFANGTRSAPGGLSLVGERGPELVDLPRGSRVIPNNKLTGMGGSIAAIVPSPYFDVVVDGRVLRAGPGFAEAGAARAHEQSAFASNWKLA